nr:hypothetical protein [Armatimonadota bacterium]
VSAWNAPVKADADDNARPPVSGHRESMLDRLSRELRLNQDQRQRVGDVLATASQDADAIRDDNSIDKDDKAPLIRAIDRTAFNRVKTFLSPQQRDRLQDIWTRQGEGAELDRLTRQLNLTEDQQEQVRGFLTREGREIDVAQDNHSLDGADRADLLRAIRQETWDKIRRILTPQQRETLADASQAGLRSGKQLNQLNLEVQLNEEQKERIRPLFLSEDQQTDRLKENRSLGVEDRNEQITAVIHSTWEKINGILTPEQRERTRNYRR